MYINLVFRGIPKVAPKTAYVDVSHAQDSLRNGTSLCMIDIMRASAGGGPSYILFMRKSSVCVYERR